MELELVVSRVVQQTADIKSFELKPTEGGLLPGFQAGAHINVAVTLNDGSCATRSYSIANGEHDCSHYELGILRKQDGAGGSAFIHDQVQVGSRVKVSAPVNNFRLEDGEVNHVLLAGGIGVTPLLSMARTLEYGAKPYEFHYFGRSETSLAFLGEVQQLKGRSGGEWFSADPDEVRAKLVEILTPFAPERHLYVCGPTGMIQATLTVADELGWPTSNVHYEQFTAGVVGLQNEAFTAVLSQSGKKVEVAADQTLLDALLKAGVDAPFDCRSGICGACLTPVCSGEIDHRDTFLSEEDKQEGGLICTCVSRARSKELILDI